MSALTNACIAWHFELAANHTEKGREMFGATLDEITGALHPVEIPDIPSRNAATIPENEPPAAKGEP
jgi:hypothetical protein